MLVGDFYVYMEITFDLSLFAGSRVRIGGLPRKESEKSLLFLLESLVNINRMLLRRNKNIPPLYKAGVRYVREQGTEIWQDCLKILKRGIGDCEDLACWRVAELRNNGKVATPYIRYTIDPTTKTYVYHVMVLRGDGSLEDPSKRLGM